jgi:hypothetical protein
MLTTMRRGSNWPVGNGRNEGAMSGWLSVGEILRNAIENRLKTGQPEPSDFPAENHAVQADPFSPRRKSRSSG